MDLEERIKLWLERAPTRAETEQSLRPHLATAGTFVIRPSATIKGDYVLSLVVGGGRIQHHQMKHRKGAMVTRSGKCFRSLPALVEHLMKEPDGLPCLLTQPCRAFDPPRTPSYSQVGEMLYGSVPIRHNSLYDHVPAPTVPSGPSLDDYELDPAFLHIYRGIGSGHFGRVFEAWYAPPRQSGRRVAVKSCKDAADEKLLQDFLQEAQTLANFQHENVLALIGVNVSTRPWCIVTEYLRYGDLRGVLRAIRKAGLALYDTEQVYIASQVAAGMQHLASKQFVHRDLAARNVLVGAYCHVKVADFGLSRELDSDSNVYHMNTKAMLPIKWMAPETFDARTFSTASDVWSFGVVLWEIWSLGSMPYSGMKTPEVKRFIFAGKRLGKPTECPSDIYEAMLSCWNEAAQDRPTFSELCTFLTETHDVWQQENPRSPRDVGQLVVSSRGRSVLPEAEDVDEEAPDATDMDICRDELRVTDALGSTDAFSFSLAEMSGPRGGRRLCLVRIVLDDTGSAKAQFEKEVEVLARRPLVHPCVLATLGVDMSEMPYLSVYEYCSQGDLRSYLRREEVEISLASQAVMAECVVSGLAYLHSKQVVHRDLTSAACFVTAKDRVKIAMIDVARATCPKDYVQTVGGVVAVRWTAPEVIRSGTFSLASDLWSLGVVLLEIFSNGDVPFSAASEMDLVETYLAQRSPPIFVPRTLSDNISGIVGSLLSVDAAGRPAALNVQEDFAKLRRRLVISQASHDEDSCHDQAQSDATLQPFSRATSDVDMPPTWVEGVGEIVHAGWLRKQGSGKGAFGKTNWKRRWFIFRDNGMLSYHTSSKPDSESKGIVVIHDATSLKEEEPFENGFAKDCCFIVETPRRTLKLVADTQHDRDKWLAWFRLCASASR